MGYNLKKQINRLDAELLYNRTLRLLPERESLTEVGIFKRKQDRKKTRKQELDQESDQEKENFFPFLFVAF